MSTVRHSTTERSVYFRLMMRKRRRLAKLSMKRKKPQPKLELKYAC